MCHAYPHVPNNAMLEVDLSINQNIHVMSLLFQALYGPAALKSHQTKVIKRKQEVRKKTTGKKAKDVGSKPMKIFKVRINQCQIKQKIIHRIYTTIVYQCIKNGLNRRLPLQIWSLSSSHV